MFVTIIDRLPIMTANWPIRMMLEMLTRFRTLIGGETEISKVNEFE